MQWFTIEFDPQCGTAQIEDYFLVSIPKSSTLATPASHLVVNGDDIDSVDGFIADNSNPGICKNARLTASTDSFLNDRKFAGDDEEWHVAQMFNK